MNRLFCVIFMASLPEEPQWAYCNLTITAVEVFIQRVLLADFLLFQHRARDNFFNLTAACKRFSRLAAFTTARILLSLEASSLVS